MKKQVVVIHGGDVYDTYEEYIANLKRETVEEDDLVKHEGWRLLLGKRLGSGFQVIAPDMPNPENARYREWKIWFEKYLPHLKGEFVLVGHSLGGIFLTKYLSENPLKGRLKGAMLVAAPFNLKGSNRSLADFFLKKDLSVLARYGDRINFYHSKDDPICLFSNLKRYKELLPKAKVHTFENRGHFIGREFPELVKDIKSLYRK